MTSFPAYATNFELHAKDGDAARHLAPLVNRLGRIDFVFRVDDPLVNQGQMGSDFDAKLEAALRVSGATPMNLTLPIGIPQDLDFAFKFGGCSVAVEIEKANHAVYQHCCLRFVMNQNTNNESIRQRFKIEKQNAATASRLLAEAVTAKKIRPVDENAANKLMRYVPYWA